MEKKDLLKDVIKHIDIKEINTTDLINAMRDMAFSSRDTATAADIYDRMINDKKCSIILTIAGSTSAAGCMQVYVDMVKSHMIDCVVSTGASIVDMDFFEALGFKHYKGTPFSDRSEERRVGKECRSRFFEALGYKHYKGTPFIDDTVLRDNYVDRIYDTFIDEEELQHCDHAIETVANGLDPRPYSSREFIWEMGKWLHNGNSKKKDSLVQVCYENNVPIFCPAFTDSSAGFGLVMHQIHNPEKHITIDSIKDFYELTQVKIHAGTTGLFMIGGGTPKNFAQDTVVCAEVLGHEVDMHKYAIQITVADVRDGACSSSTLKEAGSWGKVDNKFEQMIYAEATTVVPLIASYLYHKGDWKQREAKNLANIF